MLASSHRAGSLSDGKGSNTSGVIKGVIKKIGLKKGSEHR